MLKKIVIVLGILTSSHLCFAQSQIITTGNNLINTGNPYAGDIIIGSDQGVRHDASIMWWSSQSADRISNTGDTFYLSSWNTASPNIALGAYMGGLSYFQGNVLIGQTTQKNSAYKLDILGNVRANGITVNATGADFVFQSTYQLIPLATLGDYIKANHHLPEIPSATEMQKEGLNIGDNQVKLLQKVEELTLYLIDKDQRDKVQQDEMDAQKMQLEAASAQLKVEKEQIQQLKEMVSKLSEVVYRKKN